MDPTGRRAPSRSLGTFFARSACLICLALSHDAVMSRELNLDGGEVSVLKALGLSGSDISGEDLLALVPDLVGAELIDTVRGLVSIGYVVADKSSFHNDEEFRKTRFQVNSGYARELKGTL